MKLHTPRFGKIFVFKNYIDALIYYKHFNNRRTILKLALLKGYTTSKLHKLTIITNDNYESFWKNYKNKKKLPCFNNTPIGTYIVDNFTPTEILLSE